MRSSMKWLSLVVALAALLAFGLWQPPISRAQIAPNIVAPPGFTIVERANLSFPLTGVTITVAKMVNLATGEGQTLAINVRGQAVDMAALNAAEENARSNRYGKLEPYLAESLTSGQEIFGQVYDPLTRTVKIPTAIWLNTPSVPSRRSSPDSVSLDPAIAGAQAESEVRAHLAVMESTMAPQRESVLAALRRMGASPAPAQYAPVVFATLTATQIRSIAQHPDVLMVFGPSQKALHLQHSATSNRSYRTWGLGGLGVGYRSRPVIHEPDGVSDRNPFLDNLLHPVLYWCSSVNSGDCNVGKNFSDADQHASEVAGTISSTHPTYRGMAPSAQVLLSANTQDWSDIKMTRAYEWAVSNNGGPVNMSWGYNCIAPNGPNYWSYFVDWATANLWSATVASAGNQGGACTIRPPADAWTAITVGAHSDNGTGWWSDDSMASFSAYLDPSRPIGAGWGTFAVPKPEVTAVGQSVMTTSITGITPSPGVDGTSFSSPTVAGQVVQLLGKNPALIQWPEILKSAVLVSAVQDVQAGSTDRDGLGGVVTNMSYNSTYYGASVPGTATGDFLTYNVTLSAGKRVRIATSWDARVGSKPVSGGAAPSYSIGADIDLYVYRGTTLVASSSSVARTWELVDFVVPAGGAHTIKLRMYAKDAGWGGTYMGTAWAYYDVADFCTHALAKSIVNTGTLTSSVTAVNGPAYFNSYPGWAPDQLGREALLKLTIGASTYPTRTLTVTDNSAANVHIVQITSCGNPPSALWYDSATGTAVDPAVKGGIGPTGGIYYVVVDFPSTLNPMPSTSVTLKVSTP